jgi:hypothetical protein
MHILQFDLLKALLYFGYLLFRDRFCFDFRVINPSFIPVKTILLYGCHLWFLEGDGGKTMS